MFGLIKIIGAAVAGGAVLGAIGSSKVGDLFNRNGEKARAKRTQVKVVEVEVDSDDPDNLDFVVIKRKKVSK